MIAFCNLEDSRVKFIAREMNRTLFLLQFHFYFTELSKYFVFMWVVVYKSFQYHAKATFIPSSLVLNQCKSTV